jgi:hypothetical protein
VADYEQREIIYARGLDFNHGDPTMDDSWQVPEAMNDRLGGTLQNAGANTWTYRNDAQEVDYTVRVVNTRRAFKDALETEGAMVVYGGHSRYGRGTCFGTDRGPGDQWENGNPDGSSSNGIFRLGYPYVPVDVHDVEAHQYHFTPIPAENPRPRMGYPRSEFYRSLSPITLPTALQSLVKSGHASPTHRYWGYGSGAHAKLIMVAGYENTESDPFDLGAVNMSCRVFCHFGCSTFAHFYRLVRRVYGWSRDGDNRFAYWTTKDAVIITPILWIYHVLTYGRLSRGQPWAPLMSYAASNTNTSIYRELRDMGYRSWEIHRII